LSGITKLNLDEIRNDIDKEALAEYHKEAIQFVEEWVGDDFDTIILDPPYAYRKAMEMYKGNYNSKFKLLADKVLDILKKDGIVISFGYHSTFLGKKRKSTIKWTMCVCSRWGHNTALLE